MAQSPSSTTSAPADSAPSAKAAAIEGDERRTSWPTAIRFAPGDGDEGRADALGALLVELARGYSPRTS